MKIKNLQIARLRITVSRPVYRPDENDTDPCNIPMTGDCQTFSLFPRYWLRYWWKYWLLLK